MVIKSYYHKPKYKTKILTTSIEELLPAIHLQTDLDITD